MSSKTFIRGHGYVDAFAGAGTHVSRETGDTVSGSPINALQVRPPFTELHFIDLDGTRVDELRRLAEGDSRVTVHEGDCNHILLQEVLPRFRYDHFRRALCLLDPYGLNVCWEVLAEAGRMKSVEIFYNFMIMDANMNVFMKNPGNVTAEQAARMDAVWGDRSWRETAYRHSQDLFGPTEEKSSNEDVAEAFRRRLQQVAGFAYVPAPIPMRNSRGAVIYYLYFASPDKTGGTIVAEIFDTYRTRGAL